MKIQYIRLFLSLFVILIIQTTWIQAQNQPNKEYATIKSVVLDYNDIPIAGVQVFGNEGDISTKTDASGNFEIKVPAKTMLLIEANGYKSLLFNVADAPGKIRLEATKPFFGENDEVNIAFGKVKKGALTNAVSTINASGFIRKDNPQWFEDAIFGRIPGLLGGSNIRGLGSAVIVVNGIPRDYFNIPFEEIAEITVLKDANASVLYGSQAVNGVILITTKKGQAHKKEINVNARTGILIPKAYPKYLGSADYMSLYNEASINDGYTAIYDEATIANYRNGNINRYPNVDYYSNEYLKSFANYNNVSTTFSGGNELATYYTNLDWYNEGSLLNFGEGKNSKQNRFNIRGNIDFKISDFISSTVDVVAVMDLNNTPVGNYWEASSNYRPNLFSPLIPISMIAQSNGKLVQIIEANKNKAQYVLGGTQEYLTNPIADVYAGGKNQNVNRVFQFDDRINFDLNQWVRGLTFSTHLNIDFISNYDQYVENKYSIYEATWSSINDSIIDLTQKGQDARPGTQNVRNTSSYRRFGFYGQLDYEKNFGTDHHFTGTLLMYGNALKWNGSYQLTSYANLGLRLTYDYKNKYFVDFSSAYTNSTKLPDGNRAGFSPTLGLSWLVSSEKFLSGVANIDYLKIRASAGIINTDSGIDGFFYYDNRYQQAGTFGWHDGVYTNSGSSSVNGLNKNLFFEQRKDINIGFESLLFNKLLWLDANVFTIQMDGLINQPYTIYPSYYSDFIPYENYNKNVYKGIELGFSVNKQIGGIALNVGGNMMYATSKILKSSEVWKNDYQYRVGGPVDAVFGLVDQGFFIDADDITNHAVPAFGEVVPGDIKYADQNGDNVVDANDQIRIGRSQAPFSYALNISLSYKNLTLFAIGTGRAGADDILNSNYYWVDGDDKYSEIVLNRWSQQTKNTATYPRLSALDNNNNYRNSTFWLYKSDYFSINRIQLTYDIPESFARKLAMNRLSIYANGNGLFTFSNNRDKMELNVGKEPQYRYISIGLKTQF